MKIEKKYHWEDDDSLFVNVIYENEVTDVSAEFSIIKGKKGYFVERSIIHIA